MKRVIIILILLILTAIAGIWFKDALIALMPQPEPAAQQPPAAPAPGTPAEQNTPAELPAATAPPAVPVPPVAAPEPPVAQPTPPAEPPAPPAEPAKPAERKPVERPHSAEHAAVLQVSRAVEPEAKPQELDALVEKGSITPEAARAIRDWAAANPEFKVEEVGTVISRNEGEKETRYRFVAPEGGKDALVTVTSPKQGQPFVSKAETAATDKTQVTSESDALTMVEGFVESLKRGDMAAARRMTTGKEVSDASLAGLCMMFEEGDFAMRKAIPIRNMFQTEENAGFLIYMAAQDGSRKSGNVGIEAVHLPDRGWAVKAVALDNLLNRYETSGEAEGGVYFPIVKNPQGGDSLVLYFGFNDAALSPRSLSQLKIVASLLCASKGALSISGHTDDIGSDSYNQRLSERRAAAVKEALVSYGVEAGQISTKGMGKSQPRRTYHAGDSAQTISNIRSGNRRAEIYLDF